MGSLDANLAKEQIDELVGESLSVSGVPQRVHYAAGVLLDAQDFADEQLYLRGRIGRAFAALYGHGTMAGLRASCSAFENPELALMVAPGLALDRLGRLIEIRRHQCIHVKRWLEQRASLGASALERVAVIDAVREDTPGARRLVLDVFVRFAVCPQGKTPAFAAGPFDATDYQVPSRIADAFELTLKLAHVVGVTPANPKGTLVVPRPRSPKLEAMLAAMQGLADPAQLEVARRLWCMESALDAWPQASALDPKRLPKLAEHASASDWDTVFLARVSVPVTQADANTFPAIDAAALAAIAAQPEPAPLEQREPRWRDLADNAPRPIVFNPYSWRGAA